jgi:transcriptional regulator with XRE-family HTH domain
MMSKSFAERLDRLFDTVYPPGRGPHSSAEVIAALRAEGRHMSAPYLSQLRSGNRTHPSPATMEALATFFRVDPRYFTDDRYFNELDKELDFLAHMRDQALQRVASRIVGLSRQAQDAVAATVEQLRREEHLDEE